ncbi:enoyl-CoA hydratase-related protein [Bradyrhizobium sp. sGM-13]|uniref:enoyl-CoA hydratase-related protein n=1 Tax=Bradyrhizobium sp. sGM-13 TaxID=2831781 RepID=UPI0035C85D01
MLDETSSNELEEIVKQTTADSTLKGVVITSGKEAFCAGADLSMLEGMYKDYARVLKEEGEIAANQMLLDQSRRLSLAFWSIETSGCYFSNLLHSKDTQGMIRTQLILMQRSVAVVRRSAA